jgi:hypothetical protein
MGQKGINFLKEEIWGRHFNNLANKRNENEIKRNQRKQNEINENKMK